MSMPIAKNKPKTAKSVGSKRISSSIKKDAIRAEDYNRYNMPYACEDCSHFAMTSQTCTLGFKTEPHLRENQRRSYEMSGHVALCRFQEID